MIKSAILFVALASVGSATVYDTGIYYPDDCSSTAAFGSCISAATAAPTCSITDEKCDCHDYLVEQDCLSVFCKDTTETIDDFYFTSCAPYRWKGFPKETSNPTKPSDAKATQTGTSTSGFDATAVSKSTTTSTSTNAAYAVAAPVGGVLGLLGVALGAFLQTIYEDYI